MNIDAIVTQKHANFAQELYIHVQQFHIILSILFFRVMGIFFFLLFDVGSVIAPLITHSQKNIV